ncbi:hypothetical protein AMATHDRAFT_155684 [Amanita thiersii Skay4041]|uniref:Coenzyme Q-binding protein COQ10 START domain-containing protein n=1 Tax=Amanita thiersii Skay4041 TaxID=703135 RepID=A0A2A9NAG0_9AGAR|nr:hypothetical protein AMATHDRAFT_155684 [Amanita thiersii Skay4041]
MSTSSCHETVIGGSNLPSITTRGAFSVSATATIDAPIDLVWDVLLDFPSYSQWQVFPSISLCPIDRGQVITDKNKRPLADQTPEVGKYLLIAPVHLPPTMGKPGWFGTSSAFEIISAVDHDEHRVAWINIDMPRFLLNAERWQVLSVDPTGQTKYETREVFGGFFSYFIKFFLQSSLVHGFSAQAEGLKKRAEQLHKAT